jgi:hypothetical protein
MRKKHENTHAGERSGSMFFVVKMTTSSSNMAAVTSVWQAGTAREDRSWVRSQLEPCSLEVTSSIQSRWYSTLQQATTASTQLRIVLFSGHVTCKADKPSLNKALGYG